MRDRPFGSGGAQRPGVLVRALLVAAGLLLVAGCNRAADDASSNSGAPADAASTAAAAPEPGGLLVYGLTGETDGWLPTASRFSPSSHMVAKAIFDPLAAYDADGKVHPYLAESFTASADLSTWDIRLRSGIVFHDGSALNADVLVANLEAHRTSLISSSVMKQVASFEKSGDLSVRLTTTEPWAHLPAMFTGQMGYVVSSGQLERADKNKPIGTGPFVFDHWERDRELVANKNDRYWQKGLPYLDAVEFRPIVDSAARSKALEAGDIDALHTSSAGDLVRFSKDDNLPDRTRRLVEETEGDEFVVVNNTQSGALADPAVRRALALATDKEALVDQLFEGYFEVADQPYAKGSKWHRPIQTQGFDLEAAKAAVQELRDGGRLQKIRLVVIASAEDSQIAQQLQGQWAQAGFEIEIEGLEETAFSAALVTGNFDALGMRFFNAPDPDKDLLFWRSSAIADPGQISLNFARYTSPTVEQSLTVARAWVDEKQRQVEYGKVWQDFADNVPYIFLYHSKWAMLYSQDVHALGEPKAPDGTPLSPMAWGSTFLTSVWLDQD